MKLLRVEAAAARAETTAARAEAAAATAELRAELLARDAAARAEATVRDAALRAMVDGRGETPLSPSYATVGSEALDVLTTNQRIYSVPAPPEGAPAAASAPVATPEDLGRLLACAWERDLVAAITPLLQAARGFDGAGGAAADDPCPRVLVNSESTPRRGARAARAAARRPAQAPRPVFYVGAVLVGPPGPGARRRGQACGARAAARRVRVRVLRGQARRRRAHPRRLWAARRLPLARARRSAQRAVQRARVLAVQVGALPPHLAHKGRVGGARLARGAARLL